MGRTQEERKAGTRSRLLASAAELFGAQGYHAVSADAVADRAERTSGALYAHFGSKDGLLHALVREMEGDAVASISFAVEGAGTLRERLEALWRSFTLLDETDAPWLLLEHELWLWAAREVDDAAAPPSNVAQAGGARASLARRYASGRAGIAHALRAWTRADADDVSSTGDLSRDVHRARQPNELDAGQTATLVLAMLLGLHMQRRIDPDAVSDETALAGLELLLVQHTASAIASNNQGV